MLGSPTSRVGETWTLATYNIHNFFDAFDNPYTADEQTRPKTAGELDALTEALHLLDVDVVVLQEVETGGFLQRFAHTRLANLRYTEVVDEPAGDPRGIGLGVLSRFPVERIVSHRLTPLAAENEAAPDSAGRHFARDLLRVDLLVRPGYQVSVYGVHLKSKRGDGLGGSGAQSAAWRLAEARAARQLMQEEMTQTRHGRFLVAGDFNDGPDSAVARALTGGLPSEAAAEEFWPLVDAFAGGSRAQGRATYLAGALQEPIDQVWLSPGLAAGIVPNAQGGGAEVMRGGVFERASDHRPVKVRLRIGELDEPRP